MIPISTQEQSIDRWLVNDEEIPGFEGLLREEVLKCEAYAKAKVLICVFHALMLVYMVESSNFNDLLAHNHVGTCYIEPLFMVLYRTIVEMPCELLHSH